MLIISKTIADTQFLSNNSFIYFWESFHMVKFQIKMSKCELSLKSIADSQFFSNNSFIYLWESFHMVKFQTHS